jgi:exoribonuclease R
MPYQYFNDHYKSDNVGIFSYSKPESPVVINDQGITYPVVETNRALDGDLVYYVIDQPAIVVNDNDNDSNTVVTVVGIKERSQNLKKIVGVLQITTTKIYGTTKRGLPIYSLVPLSWRYPNFSVPSSVKTKWKEAGPIRNVYVLTEFNEWTPFQKYPVARCVNILGTITDEEAEDMALIHKNSLHVKKYPSLPPPEPETIAERIQNDSDTIIAIDPQGSKDLDDAFHIDDKYVYVHIADVDSLFQQHGPWETEIQKRLISVYAKQTYHMLPNQYSTKVLSLNDLEMSNTVTVVLDHKLQGQRYYLSRMKTTHCLTYEKAQEIFDADADADSSSVLAKALCKLAQITESKDTHKMVERLMVATNAYIGQVLHDNGYSLARVMAVQPLTTQKSEVLSYLKYRSLKGANYAVIDPDMEDAPHSMLQKNHYVHFTSPIRRYADLIVHRLLKNPKCYTKEQLQSLATQINEYNAQVKRYYRDAAVMKLFHALGDAVETIEGYIVDYSEDSNNIYVYLPKYEIEYRYQLFSDKLNGIMSISDTDTTLILTNKQSQEVWHIPKYELVDFDLSTNWTENRLSRKVVMRVTGLSSAFFR